MAKSYESVVVCYVKRKGTQANLLESLGDIEFHESDEGRIPFDSLH